MTEMEKARKKVFSDISSFLKIKKKNTRFIPGKSKVQYSGIVYNEREVNAMVGALLDGWFGVGKSARKFELEFSRFMKVEDTVFVNSGSSANLLSMSALVQSGLLKTGDEVITPAVTFPTTFNPIIQLGLKPVLVDVNPSTYNAEARSIEDAISEKTRAIIIPHTLGNPNEMDAIMETADKRGLMVIEDSCDSLGSRYDGRLTGSFGVFGTFSFYAAHHISTGEGGAVVSNDPEKLATLRSLRDWGRACACPVCRISMDPDHACQLRFTNSKMGALPKDYDRKYIYTRIGYNLKPIEMQAAMGIEQLKKLPSFIKARKKNFARIYRELERYEDSFILPESLQKADPCWFAFPLTVKKEAGFSRKEIIGWLEKHNIETRLLFAGNILRQPAYSKVECRVLDGLPVSDSIMESAFFIGTYPGLTGEQMAFMMETFHGFMRRYA